MIASIGSILVAPLVEAWVEIMPHYTIMCDIYVAPLVGARVEIIHPRATCTAARSLPLRECGLKLVKVENYTEAKVYFFCGNMG